MTGIEMGILDFIQNNLRSGAMDFIMVFITHMGDFGAVWIAIGIAYLLKGKDRKTGAAVLAAVLIAFVIGSLVVKPLVARPRPCDANLAVQLLISRPTGFSFPSGHTAAAFAATAVLFFSHSRGRVPACVLAVLIAFSRLYLYVHYPTDVLMGVALGIFCGWLAWRLCTIGSHRLEEHRRAKEFSMPRGSQARPRGES